MAKKIACVYFDSMKMSLSVVSDRGGFGCPEFSASNLYSGVSKNFFVAPNEIEGMLVDLMNRYASFSGKKISQMTLVLPQHFFLLQPIVRTRNVQGKLTEKELNLFRKTEPTTVPDYIYLSEKEGGFCPDGKGDFSFDVVGQECSSCQMLSAGVYVSGKVYELFRNISKNIRIDFDFVAPSSPIVEKLNNEGCKRGLVLFMQSLSSDLIYFEGQLAVSSLTLSFGSAHFADLLAQKFHVDGEIAKQILRHVNFGITSATAKYVLFTPAFKGKFPAKEINDILIEAGGYWANETRSAVKGLIGEENMPLYVTGSSVAEMPGFCELFSEKIGLDVFILRPDFSRWNKPEDYIYCSLFEKI